MRLLSLLSLASILIALGCGGRPASAPDASLCGDPPALRQPLHCFQACRDDSECVAVWPTGPCVCSPWVVNRRFEELARDKARLEAHDPDGGPSIGCGCWACRQGPPACIEGVCGARYMCTKPAPDGSP